MESTLVFIGSFILIFGIVWYVIKQREKQREKRFREFMELRKQRRENHKKQIDEHYRDSLQYGTKLLQFNNQKKREIPNVPASDRINLDDSYMYQQQPFVANDDYKPTENHSSGFDHGFGGGDFSGGGAGSSWDDSPSYDSGSSSDSTYSND